MVTSTLQSVQRHTGLTHPFLFSDIRALKTSMALDTLVDSFSPQNQEKCKNKMVNSCIHVSSAHNGTAQLE